MKLLDKIKSFFIKNKPNIDDKNTNITLFDINDISLPLFNDLNDNDKKKVLKYKKKLDINNLEQIIKYNQDITLEGENITNLFIKYLYELNEITNKYGKTIDELNEESVNLAIKNFKLVVLKEELEKLRYDSYIKTIAVDIVNNEYKNRKHEFIELFSHAARIKRKNQLKSIDELETRSKITIKTLEQQLMAMTNAIINNNVIVNQVDIYNQLSNKIDDEDKMFEIYRKKLDFYMKVNISLFNSNLPTAQLGLYVYNATIYEDRIIKLMAYIELEIDKYVLLNKEKINNTFLENLVNIELINNEISMKEQYNDLLKIINYLSILSQLFNEYVDKELIDRLYEYKFYLLTIDINSSKVGITPETKEEFEVYKNIISETIKKVQSGNARDILELKYNRCPSKPILNILKEYFYKNDYDYEKILNNNFLLALLLAFDKKKGLKDFFAEYKLDHFSCHDNVNLEEDIFDWDCELSLETICRIMQVEKELYKRKEFPPFFELFRYCNKYYKYIEGFYEDRINSSRNNYILPDGICSIEYSNYDGLKNNALINKLRENSSGKTIIFPSSLWYLSGSIFGDISIKDIKLNEGITYIGPIVFINQNLKNVVFPSSLESIEGNSFDYEKIENLTFIDFKNSKLLYNLLFSEEDKYKQVLFNLYTCAYDKNIGVYMAPYISRLILTDNDSNEFIIYDDDLEFKDTTHKREVTLSMDDVKYIREHLIKVIKEKTGFDFKECNKEKSLKK